MRVLLLGARGMLARDLRGTAPPAMELIERGLETLDITDGDAVRRDLQAVRPRVVLNAAAYTMVDQAESERDLAYAVNAHALAGLGAAAREIGATVVHFSTDYVFDGSAPRPYRETDPTGPVNLYGGSKLEGERLLAGSGCDCLVVRSQWLFGVHGRSFARTMWDRAQAGLATRVVNDQYGRPTYTVDLARAVWELLSRDGAPASRIRSIIHIANQGTATWFEVAQRVFRAAGAAELLTACTTPEYPTAARRPASSVLDTTRFETLMGHSLPPWQDAIDRFLAELRTSSLQGKPPMPQPTFTPGEIHGVIARPVRKYVDERGWLLECFRTDELTPELIPPMAYVSLTRPGVCRGPHEHREQSDNFVFFGPSTFKIFLWDARKDSPTYGRKKIIFGGQDAPIAVVIPPGVVHAYRNVGGEDGLVFNAPNQLFAGEGRKQPVDEIRHEDVPGSPYVID